MRGTRFPAASPLARPIDLSAAWNASDDELAERFHPLYRRALRRLPDGSAVFRGLPFLLGSRSAGRRWLLVDRPLAIDLRGHGRATHLVVAHLCDSARGRGADRPPGTPVGWVQPIGEPLARYEVVFADGSARDFAVRRRFEIADGIIGWGSLPFAAVGHRSDEPLDWRGPLPRQAAGRYADAGQAGPLTILPGSWGPAQTGVADFVPSADDAATYWLHTLPLGGRTRPVELRLAPVGDGRPGTDVVVAALTLFDGSADPLVIGPRREILVEGFDDGLPDVDLGVAIRSRRAEPPLGRRRVGPTGWGGARARRARGERSRTIVDVALAPDARLGFGGSAVGAAALDAGEVTTSDGRRVSIQPLPARDVRIEIRLVGARPGGGGTVGAGEAAGVGGHVGDDVGPARVRLVAADGRYLAPLGHRDEVNPGICEDTGADLLLDGDTYAYVEGRFEVDLPPGEVGLEVVKGFEHRPVRTVLQVGAATRRLDVPVERAFDPRAEGWLSSDSHVHFLSPSTALLQAAAEDVAFVHLLATQWGDHVTSFTDLPWGSATDPSGRHAVIVGTENRQNVLGHLALLGARRPVVPMAAGGAPEGRIGGPLTELLADWADRCHAEGGLVVAAHFPLPYAEIAADIVAGRVDAVEMQCFSPGLDTPSILEWYRFLDCGHRLPVVGGTDKMSAEVPVGAVRTYARLDPATPPSFESWAAAVRAGRTFATSGPLIELSVDGHEPGDVVALPASGGRLEARARVRAAQSIVGAIEIVLNGRVVAARESAAATDELSVAATLEIRSGAWIAARSRSDHEIGSAFRTSMASHTSPVYVDVRDRPLFSASDAAAILEVVEGTLGWIRTMAAVERPDDRRRMVEVIESSARSLRDRIEHESGGIPR